MEATDSKALLSGYQKIWQLMFGFADSMVLKCAIELGIADIINSHGGPITLSQIASGIDSSCPDMAYLNRIMRFLVHKDIFSVSDENGETLYGLTNNSRWLLQDSEFSLSRMVLLQNHPWQLAPWHCLSQCVKEGGTAFEKAHGCDKWDFASKNPEFNRIFCDALSSTAEILTRAIISNYKDGFNGIESLVDVRGGTGKTLAEIVKNCPHIKGVNFDLPHVVAIAPTYDGVSHMAGNMFETIPNADAIFMKAILHDWGDEYCVKILKNCRKAIPEKTGKLIVVDMVLEEDASKQVSDIGLIRDLLMFAQTKGGKERTELEWKKLLEEGGFLRYKIIKIPALLSIIEAYPE